MDQAPKIVDKKLLCDGYVYLKSRERNSKVYWDCKRLRVKECTARAVTVQSGDQLVILRGPEQSPHDHPPNREEGKILFCRNNAVTNVELNIGEAEIVKHRLKRTASDHPEQPPAHIIRHELAHVPAGVLSQLPERTNLSKAMRGHRRRDLPPNPTSLENMGVIPDRFQNTLSGERFLIYDSEATEGRVIVFATRRNLELLAKSTTWFLDGTFKVSPTIFTQVFTVLGLVKKNPRSLGAPAQYIAFPLNFAFLTSKETTQYTAVLQSIVSSAAAYAIPNCSPQILLGDFEKGIINACAAVFPNVTYSGCFFHFCQSVYRKIQGEGLQEQYNNPCDRDLKHKSHMLMALAFVPVSDVRFALDILANEVPEELNPIVDYIREYYVTGRPRRGRRRAVPPRYPIPIWNQYQACCDGSHKTNNISEGWHNRFRLLLGKHHPDLYIALREFQKEQADTEIMIAEISLGQTVKAAPKKKWLDFQNRLRSIVLLYQDYKEQNDLLQYLQNLAHNNAMQIALYTIKLFYLLIIQSGIQFVGNFDVGKQHSGKVGSGKSVSGNYVCS